MMVMIVAVTMMMVMVMIMLIVMIVTMAVIMIAQMREHPRRLGLAVEERLEQAARRVVAGRKLAGEEAGEQPDHDPGYESARGQYHLCSSFPPA
jgi:hypothetical protein